MKLLEDRVFLVVLIVWQRLQHEIGRARTTFGANNLGLLFRLEPSLVVHHHEPSFAWRKVESAPAVALLAVFDH
jgi:hypothetical protein